MFFLVDNKYKIIFGWSAKCGCSHVKRIFNFLTTNKIDGIIHTGNEMHKLPDDIINYTTIIISRNPYKRLISGFLDKYSINGHFRHFWKYKFITFSRFINELLKNDWKMVDKHHFTPQTTEKFDKETVDGGRYEIVDISHNEAVNKHQVHFCSENNIMLSDYFPGNLFWDTHLGNMQQQSFTVKEYWAEMEKRNVKRILWLASMEAYSH